MAAWLVVWWVGCWVVHLVEMTAVAKAGPMVVTTVVTRVGRKELR